MFEAKNAFIGALLVLRKFTIFNVKFYAETEESDYSFAVFLLPLLGLIIGLGSLAISIFKLLYAPMFIGALLLIYYCIITKSANIKDTYKTINIIINAKDDNKQFYSIISLVTLCILYFALFSVSSIRAIILMPMVGFSNLITQALIIKRDKTCAPILKYSTRNHSIFAFAFSFILTIIINYRLAISLSLTYIIVSFLINYFDSKIKIVPSSVEGFVIEISQILFLILSYLLML
jgi:hypothetical protein